jgi:hypothetical protein
MHVANSQQATQAASHASSGSAVRRVGRLRRRLAAGGSWPTPVVGVEPRAAPRSRQCMLPLSLRRRRPLGLDPLRLPRHQRGEAVHLVAQRVLGHDLADLGDVAALASAGGIVALRREVRHAVAREPACVASNEGAQMQGGRVI